MNRVSGHCGHNACINFSFWWSPRHHGAVVREIDARAIPQAAIAPDIERREVGLALDYEPALEREAGILLSIQRPFRTVIDVHVVHIRIHHLIEGRRAIDLLDR